MTSFTFDNKESELITSRSVDDIDIYWHIQCTVSAIECRVYHVSILMGGQLLKLHNLKVLYSGL